MHNRLQWAFMSGSRTLVAASLCCVLAAAPAWAQTGGTATAQPPVATGAGVAGPSAAAATPAAKATTKVDNPYSISALWSQSDAVTKTMLVLLALMSMASWYVIATKLREQRRMGRQATKAGGEFWNAPVAPSATAPLADGSPLRFVAQAGLDATARQVGLRAKVDFNDWIDLSMHRATERVQRQLFNGMTVLATVGSVSPFVGMFGTVSGIHHALTAHGLAVAVPSVMGYNWLLRRNLDVISHLREFSGELHSVLLGTAQPAGPAASLQAV